VSDFRKYLLELEAFYKNQAQCKQSLGGATAALSDERISKLFGHLINEFDAANNRPQWTSVGRSSCQQDFEYWCCKDDDVFTAIYREDDSGEWFENHYGRVEVDFIQELPTPPTQED